MQLKDIMQPKVVTVTADGSLWEVKMLFENTKFHHLLVTDDKKLVGVVSDRDYLKAASPNLNQQATTAADGATLNQRVSNIMSTQLKTLAAEDSIFDAITLFNQANISCIPIVDHDMNIKGIISWRDIMKLMYEKMNK
jgi:acetoin utilization protein AcuB